MGHDIKLAVWDARGAERIRRLLSARCLPRGDLGSMFWWDRTDEGYQYWHEENVKYVVTGILTDEVRKKLELLVVEWELLK